MEPSVPNSSPTSGPLKGLCSPATGQHRQKQRCGPGAMRPSPHFLVGYFEVGPSVHTLQTGTKLRGHVVCPVHSRTPLAPQWAGKVLSP